MKKKQNMTAGERTAETARKVRGTWGSVNPVTKVIPDKRRKAPKHKGRELDD